MGKYWLIISVLFCTGLLSHASADARDVWVLHLNGPVSAAASEYLVGGIDDAHDAAARPSVIILEMDTPGGLDSAMRVIIKRILSSQIPIVGFVSPQGARAASAGTYILYACHVAAMSHATTLGAATPVQLMGQPAKDDDEQASSAANAMQRKVLNDAIAYIEGLARLRKRNSEWAADAVRSAVSLEAEQALEQNVINLVAESIPELLAGLHGLEVSIEGKVQTLATKNAEILDHQPSWRHNVLAILTDPNIAYLLLILGVYGLFFEASNPGLGLPGILGALCILMSLYAFQLLPINYAGVALILVGISLMVAEALAPSFGVLGIGGIAALILGSLLLIDSTEPALQIALPLIISVAVFSAGFIILTLTMLIRHRKSRLVAGAECLCGEATRVESLVEGRPMVRVQGELWQTKTNSDVQLQIGDHVKVLGVDGLRLCIQPINQESDNGKRD